VKITAPAPGTAINVGQGTVIQGEANGDNITRVEVVVDGKAYASLSTPDKTKGVANFPVSVPWTPMAAGTHAIQLRAYGLDDKLLGQSEPLVMDAKTTLAQVTPTSGGTQAKPTSAATAAPVATSLPTAASVATATPAPAATSPASAAPSIVVTNDFVNVRSGPNVGYQLLGRLDKGQTAPVRGKNDDGSWWQISYAAGASGVGWVFGDYVQANAAANNVPVASAPPLPTQPPQPTSPPLPTLPPPTAIPPTAIVQTLPLIGSQGQLHVDQNPIPSGGTVTAYWNVSNIAGIWFDKGDGAGFQAAGGSQSVSVSNVTSQRTLQLKWQTNGGQTVIDQLVVSLSGQAVATTIVTQNCTSSDPNWRGGGNANYPFCVSQELSYSDGGDSVRYFGYSQDVNLTATWNVYGISGIWLNIDSNGDKCGPAGTNGRSVSVSGNGSYTWNIKDLVQGGYLVHLKIQRNDGQIVYYNEKYLCINVGNNPANTKTPVPPANTPAPSTKTPVPPTPFPTSAP
jgi:uncharacterized protein YgiM (DUF1202 family)